MVHKYYAAATPQRECERYSGEETHRSFGVREACRLRQTTTSWEKVEDGRHRVQVVLIKKSSLEYKLPY